MLAEHYWLRCPDDSTKIWRYVGLTKFLSLLSTRKLYLCRADKLDDPLEGVVPQVTHEYAEAVFSKVASNSVEMAAQFAQVMRASREFTFVNCWHINDRESDAMWKLYSLVTEGVAIQSTVGRLKACLSAAPDRFFVGSVQYADHDEVPPEM